MAKPSNHPMTPQDWFGVGVRLFALYPLALACQQLLYFVNLRLAVVSSRWSGTGIDANPVQFLFYAFGYTILSLVLLRAAPLLVAFAYPSRTRENDDEPDSE